MHAAVLPSPLVQLPSSAKAPARARRQVPGLAQLRTVVRQSRRHGLWIAAWSIIGWVGTALSPALMDKPFLLMMLSPRALFVALASDSVSLIPFVLLGTARLSMTDASYYIIGKRFPGSLKSTSQRPPSRWTNLMRNVASKGDRLCRWFCDRPRLAGAFLFVRPNAKYLGLAGAYQVPAWVAGLSATLGTASFLTAMHLGLGAIF